MNTSFLMTLIIVFGVLNTGIERLGSFAISSKAFADEPILLAKNQGNSVKKGTREKTIVREKIYRGDSRKIDFDAIDIAGEKKSPFGTMVTQNKARKEYDLIKIRLRWHDEMKSSTSSLENGRAAN